MSVLRSAVNAIDPAPDKKSQTTLLLSLLTELCKQHVETFSTAIQNDLRTAGVNPENKTVPVTEILASHEEYRAFVKSDVGKIPTEVSDAVKKFFSGTTTDIIDGVTSLVTTAIQLVLGAGEATEQEMKTYYIVVQDFGIARYDVRVWSRQIEADGITSEIENAMAIVAFKSSVDVNKISLNTFLIAYGSQLALMNFPPEKVKEYIDSAKIIYNDLRGETSPAATSGVVGFAQPGDIRSSGLANFHSPGEFRGSLWRQ